MSQSADPSPTTREVIELMRSDPDDVLREHQDRLRELRDETDSPRLRTVIDVVLESYQDDAGGDSS